MKTTGYKYIYAAYINNLEIVKYLKNETSPVCIYDQVTQCEGTVWNQFIRKSDIKPEYSLKGSTYYTIAFTISGLQDDTLYSNVSIASDTSTGSFEQFTQKGSVDTTYVVVKTFPDVSEKPYLLYTVHNPSLNLGDHQIHIKIYEGDVVQDLT